MRSIKNPALILLAALCLFGCAEAQLTDPTWIEPPAGPPPAVKGDCPNCDPQGPSAFVQSGLQTRWYRPGDAWHVAFQFRQRNDMAMSDRLATTEQDAQSWSGLYLFGYQVVGADTDVFGNQLRDIVTVEVKQADPEALGVANGPFESERLDTHQHRVRFRMNDLTDALDITVFDRQYPNGKTTRAPSKSALALGDSIFPVNVPRLLAGTQATLAPVLPDGLAALADAIDSGWRDRTYLVFEFGNGDVVYWARGFLWPFYVENTQGRGLLLDGLAQ